MGYLIKRQLKKGKRTTCTKVRYTPCFNLKVNRGLFESKDDRANEAQLQCSEEALCFLEATEY